MSTNLAINDEECVVKIGSNYEKMEHLFENKDVLMSFFASTYTKILSQSEKNTLVNKKIIFDEITKEEEYLTRNLVLNNIEEPWFWLNQHNNFYQLN